MWREFIRSLTANANFAPPASSAEIAEVEERFGVALPSDLRNLLQETNGLTVTDYSCILQDGEPAQWRIICSTQEIIEENLFWRNANEETTQSPLLDLLFFTQEPNGDPVGFPISGGIADETKMVVLSHETWEPHVIIGSLRDYLTRFL